MADIADTAEAEGTERAPVTAEDVRHSVRLALAALHPCTGEDFGIRAGSLEWDCWDTLEHLSDDLFVYATQLAPETPSSTDGVPFSFTRRQPGAPANAIFADRDAGPAGALRVLEAGGGLLAAMVSTAPSHVRAFHPYGNADPEGFAAMGIVETLVHVHDIAEGLGISWAPPDDLCARVLRRLFRDEYAETYGEPGTAPVTDAPSPWPVLLWATGRTEMPGRPRRTSWKWDSTPLP